MKEVYKAEIRRPHDFRGDYPSINSIIDIEVGAA